MVKRRTTKKRTPLKNKRNTQRKMNKKNNRKSRKQRGGARLGGIDRPQYCGIVKKLNQTDGQTYYQVELRKTDSLDVPPAGATGAGAGAGEKGVEERKGGDSAGGGAGAGAGADAGAGGSLSGLAQTAVVQDQPRPDTLNPEAIKKTLMQYFSSPDKTNEKLIDHAIKRHILENDDEKIQSWLAQRSRFKNNFEALLNEILKGIDNKLKPHEKIEAIDEKMGDIPESIKKMLKELINEQGRRPA